MTWKTRKRQRGGAVASQSACPTTTENYKDMALHALMDMVHDHGLGVKATIDPLVQGHRNKDEVGIGNYSSEEQGRKYFERADDSKAQNTIEYKLSRLIHRLPQRLEDKIEFLLNEETAYFRNDQIKGIVRFFYDTESTDNSTVGVVQDNGELIYNKIGGLNVLTFGSILDQAKKPKDPKSNPVYMLTPDAQLRINLCEYGIRDIDYIHINGFRITADKTPVVKCYFGKKFGTQQIKWIDAIKPIGTYQNPNAVNEETLPIATNPTFGLDKPINVFEIKNAGYFTSIKSIAEMSSNASLASYINTEEKKRNFYLGKFFGDTSLVASISPHINLSPEPTTNPFFNLNQARWIYPQAGNPTLTNIMLKTFDQLNFVRAMIKGRPVVYQQAKTKESDLYFLFMPGEDLSSGVKPIDPATLITSFQNTINESMIQTIRFKYQELIDTLRSCITNQQPPKVLKAKFDASDIHKLVLNTQRKKEKAAELINQTIDCIEIVKNSVITKIETLRDELTGLTDTNVIKNNYKYIESIVPNLIPFATILKKDKFTIFDVLLIKQKKDESLFSINNIPIVGKLVIRFKEAFEIDPDTQVTKYNSNALFVNFINPIQQAHTQVEVEQEQEGGAKTKKGFTPEELAAIESAKRYNIQEEVYKAIENTSKELFDYLISNKEKKTNSGFQFLVELIYQQMKQEKQIVDFLNIQYIQDSYPNFYKFHSFLQSIHSTLLHYSKNHLLTTLLFSISTILICNQKIDYIYDQTYFKLVKNEAFSYFIDLTQLNIDSNDVAKLKELFTEDDKNNLSQESLLNEVNNNNNNNNNNNARREGAKSRLGELPNSGEIRRGFTKKLPKVASEGSIAQPKLIGTSRNTSFLSVAASLSHTNSNNNNNNNNYNNNNNNNNNSNNGVVRIGGRRFTMRGSGRIKATTLGTARFTRGLRKKTSYKAPKGPQFVSFEKVEQFHLDLKYRNIKNIESIEALLENAESKFNFFSFEYNNTICNTHLRFNIEKARYEKTYEKDSKSIIGRGMKKTIDLFKNYLKRELDYLNQNYKVLRSGFYIF